MHIIDIKHAISDGLSFSLKSFVRCQLKNRIVILFTDARRAKNGTWSFAFAMLASTLLMVGVGANAQSITTIAGNGTQGASGDNGPALAASFYYPNGLAVDSGGNVYVSVEGSHRVRKISTDGIVTSFAGSGSAGFGGDGGPASSAFLNSPHGLTFDSSDNLYIADTSNHRIRKVTPAGIISTVAGSSGVPRAFNVSKITCASSC